jgi:lysylphosphatidylglycerol synthetase-like protein (DUF2156 family)
MDEPETQRRRAGRFRRANDRYFLVILLLFLSLLIMAVAGDNDVGRGVALVVLALTLLVTFRTSEWPLRLRSVVAWAAVAVVLVVVVVILAGGDEVGRAAAATVGLCLVVAAVAAIVKRLASHPEISFRTVMGALCIYLYFILFFSQLYVLVDALAAKPFFAQTDHPQTVTFIYFSMITLATVGYGDFTSALDVGRVLAGIEGLVGQLYLVSVVALLVGNIGGKLQRPRMSSEDDETPGEQVRDD